jgi:hypothetical protein
LKQKLFFGCAALIVLAAGAVIYVWKVPIPGHYEQDPISAQLTDAQTGQPIPGAAVVAIWFLAHSGMEATWTRYRYDEAVTDAQGRFTLAGWSKVREQVEGRLRDDDPDLYIYKPGYKSLQLKNNAAYVPVIGLSKKWGRVVWTPVRTPEPGQVAEKYPGWRWSGAKRYCFWNGKEIAMEPTRSAQEDLEALRISDEFAYDLHDDKLPKFWPIWRGGRQRLPIAFQEQVAPY